MMKLTPRLNYDDEADVEDDDDGDGDDDTQGRRASSGATTRLPWTGTTTTYVDEVSCQTIYMQIFIRTTAEAS